MSDAAPKLGSCIFMLAGHGDLKIDWNDDNHEEVIKFIQAKMDAGVAFHILDPESKAKNPTLVEIENTNQISGRQVYVRDPEIKHIVEAGFASIASFAGTPELKTKGKAKTAAEAAAADTVAVAPKKGG